MSLAAGAGLLLYNPKTRHLKLRNPKVYSNSLTQVLLRHDRYCTTTW